VQELITFVKTKITIFCTKTKLNGMNVRYFNNTQGHTDKLEDIIRVAHTFDQRANQDLQNNAQKGKIAQHIPQKGELR
jgi:hypothetical protein